MSELHVIEFPGFPYFWMYFIKPFCFPFLIFLNTESSSSCVNCLSLMSNWLLILFVIGPYLTFGGFPSKFSKCYFYMCVRSSWLTAFSLVLAVLFLQITSFTICHAILDCLFSTKSLILLIWFCMYSVCSFTFTLVNSFWAFLSFPVLILVGLHLFYKAPIFTSARFFFLTTNVSQRTLDLFLCLVGMHSTAASKWALTKFIYSLFEVGVFDISWSASNTFLCVNVYLFLISLLLSRDQ